MKIVRKKKNSVTEIISESGELEQKKKSLMKKKRKKRAKRRAIIFLFLFVCIGIILAVLKAPFFNVKTVYCVGQSSMSEDEILKIADVSTGKNIFGTNIRAVKKRLALNPEIAESNVRRIFPNKIKIWVKEAKPVAYIENGDSLLMIDKDGQILKSIQKDKNKEMSIGAKIEGLQPESQIPGEYIAAPDDQRAQELFECLANLENLKMLESVNYINFKDLSDIQIDYENRLFMLFGDYEDLEYKLKFVKKVIADSISEYEKALFDYRGDKLYVGPREKPEEETKAELNEEKLDSPEPTEEKQQEKKAMIENEA